MILCEPNELIVTSTVHEAGGLPHKQGSLWLPSLSTKFDTHIRKGTLFSKNRSLIFLTYFSPISAIK